MAEFLNLSRGRVLPHSETALETLFRGAQLLDAQLSTDPQAKWPVTTVRLQGANGEAVGTQEVPTTYCDLMKQFVTSLSPNGYVQPGPMPSGAILQPAYPAEANGEVVDQNVVNDARNNTSLGRLAAGNAPGGGAANPVSSGHFGATVQSGPFVPGAGSAAVSTVQNRP